MPNSINAKFYGRKNVAGLMKATIRQKFANHTVTMLDYDIRSHRDYLLPPENTPVSLAYGTGPTNATGGYGYVNHYETVTGSDNRALTRMVMLGTSKVMDSVLPTSWSDYTRSGIAREIASRHRLRSVVHNHPAVVDAWATGGRSDFQCLKALAAETGYLAWVDGATLWFLDPAQTVRSASALNTPNITSAQQRTVQVLGGSNIPGEMKASKRQLLYGVDASTNEFFKATGGSPLHPAELVGSVADNFAAAKSVTDASGRQQQDVSVLKASINGNARVEPGAVINFAPGRVNTDQVGLWVVQEAVHEIDSRDYVTHLVATRGAERVALGRVPNTIRTASGHARAVVRDGLIWEAALQERVYV